MRVEGLRGALFCLAFLRVGAAALTLAAPLAVVAAPTEGAAQAVGQDALPIKDRHIDVSRAGTTESPRSEGDQALAEGWPLYRTERGQQAFNDTLATLRATDGAAPVPAAAFRSGTFFRLR